MLPLGCCSKSWLTVQGIDNAIVDQLPVQLPARFLGDVRNADDTPHLVLAGTAAR